MRQCFPKCVPQDVNKYIGKGTSKKFAKQCVAHNSGSFAIAIFQIFKYANMHWSPNMRRSWAEFPKL